MTIRLTVANLLLLVLALPVVRSRNLQPQGQTASGQQSEQQSQVTVPSRPATPPYKGPQGTQRSEIEFTPLSRTVTIKLHVEDPSGYFLPNIRRENFAVYEDGVRQKNVDVEVEHSPVSVALLMEFGGRYHELNQVLGLEVARIGHRLLDVADRDDKIAILKYAAKLDTVVDFNQGRQDLENVFDQLSTPVVSEANFYDALLETLHRMRDVSGRKAIIVISTGVDTFSKADYQQVLQVAQTSATPIYTIGLVRLMQRESEVYGPTAPISRIDWNGAEAHLEMLARVSGGRAYVLDSDTEIPAIYDDIMENLRLRYVVTYVSSNRATSGPPRKIRVDLIDPRTGEALKIRDSNGKLIAARVFVQETYSPKSAAGG
jgi:Ca-activated chloride channel family protein